METKTNSITYVEVKNRNNGFTSYVLPNGVTRQFTLGQVRKVDIDELRELRDCPGGEYLLKNFLIVNDKTALDYLDMSPEPEYFYTDKEIKILLESGSLDQLEDTLNFAPQGVIDIIKDMAVKMNLSDIRKRELILEKTNFNITTALQINKMLDEETKEPEKKTERKATPVEVQSSGRKAAPLSVDTEPSTKTTTSKYKVVD